MRRFHNRALAALIFAVVSLGLFWLHGNHMVFNNDEGTILDSAERMLHGQTIYRDFYGAMTPGAFWIQEASFRLFGVTLLAGRLMVIFDFAFQCALLFWLAARFAGRNAGFAAAALFFAFQVTIPNLLLANHRMDSAALSLVSIALCLEAHERRSAWRWVVAGAVMTLAAACTPSIALLALATLVWLVAEPALRRFLLPYAAGLGAAASAIAVVLVATGSLGPLIDQMKWLGRNYSELNIMPYGAIIGGYAAALGSGHGFERVVRTVFVFCFALPAILPVVALVAWSCSLLLRRAERAWAAKNAIPYLLACMVLYAVSTYPRADVAHLAFVTALPAALTAIWIARYAPPTLMVALLTALVVTAGPFLAQAASLRCPIALATPVGTVRATPDDARALGALLQAVHPGDTLYVHPYQPLLYFLTQGRNPTRYPCLAPGLMTHPEEVAVLDALKESPPRWLLYLPLARAEFLRVFPHATRLDHRFRLIEAWTLQEYVPVEPEVNVAGYRLYERRPIPAPGP